ncbi:MAG: choice-of-anchor tandem repeat NxxGxxAF-containing protein [Planctomycetota bacterium]
MTFQAHVGSCPDHPCGLFRYPGTKILYYGDQVFPGHSYGCDYSSPPAINAAGHIAHRTWLSGGPHYAICVSDGTDHFAIAIGDQDEVAFAPDALAINSAHQVAFRQGTGSPGSRLWSVRRGDWSGENRIIAMQGMHDAPLPGSGREKGTWGDLAYYGIAINELGQVAFRGKLDDGREGIWMTYPDGTLAAIAVESYPFEVAPGDVRTVREVSLNPDRWEYNSGGEDGCRLLLGCVRCRSER